MRQIAKLVLDKVVTIKYNSITSSEKLETKETEMKIIKQEIKELETELRKTTSRWDAKELKREIQLRREMIQNSQFAQDIWDDWKVK